MVARQSGLAVGLLVLWVAGACGEAGTTAGTSGSGPEPVHESGTRATVVVTEDYGREPVLEETVPLEPSMTAMDALRSVASVDTAYGGGFVTAINGRPGGQGGRDWFLYINGICSNVGACDYVLNAGDVERWDLRTWGYHRFVPAIIADFPHPFVSGYGGNRRPTAVLHEEGIAQLAASVSEKLGQSGADVTVGRLEQVSQKMKEEWNVVVMATAGRGLAAELNRAHRELGFWAYFDGTSLVLLDEHGEETRRLGSGSGVIQATQSPWNPKGTGVAENVVWMVAGVDLDGVRSAVRLLLDGEAELRHAYAVAVHGDTTFRLPC
jgi:hypothetical protein